MWLFKRKVVDPVQPASAILAQPPGINIQGRDKLHHARYRVDAICRHVEQNSDVPVQALKEFLNEARIHCANLLAEDAMTEDESILVINKIKEAQLNAIGNIHSSEAG